MVTMKFPVAVGIIVLSFSSLSIAGCFDFLNNLSPNAAGDNVRKVIQNLQAKICQEIDAHQKVIQSLERQKQFLIEEDTKIVDMAHFLSSGPYELSGLRAEIKSSSDNYASLFMDTNKAEKYLKEAQIQYYRAAGKQLQILRNIFEIIGAKNSTLPPPLFETLGQLHQKLMEGEDLNDVNKKEISIAFEMAAKFESLNMWDMAYSIYQNISERFNEMKEGNSGCHLALIEIYHKTISMGELMGGIQTLEDDAPVFHFGEPNHRSKYEREDIDKIGLGTERDIFDQAIAFLNEEKWQQANDFFKQAWTVFNESEAVGQDHTLDEVYIVDYVQYSSFKVGRVAEAHAACLRALNHIALTDEQRTRFKNAFDFYDKELSQTSEEASSQRLSIEDFQLGTEREIFDEAIELLNQGKWQPAYNLFKQAWELYNMTEAAGQYHTLNEVYIVDYVQYTSFKVGRTDEARAACLWALDHLILTSEQQTRFRGAFDVYHQELSHQKSQRHEDFKLGTEKEVFDDAIKLLGERKWHEAYDGFKQAWKIFNATEAAGHRHSLDEVYIVDYVQYISFKVHKVEEAHAACLYALNHISLTVEQRKNFERAYEFYDLRLLPTGLEDLYRKIDNVPTKEKLKIAEKALSSKQYHFCQDEVVYKAMKKLSENPKLFCRYDNRNLHPLLILSPVKEEILSLSPVITLVYGLITEKEIQSLKDSVVGKLVPATALNRTTHKTQVQAHIKYHKRTWIDTAAMPSLTSRLEASLGVNPYGEACENYHVIHYNIGGHFAPHIDIVFDAAEETGLGDRIATLLLYLNEAEQGGATFFSDLKIGIMPTKGAGLFWYNFHKNETANLKTMHGGCPVIRGEKWVTRKSYRWRGQLVHIPHGIKENDDFTLEDLNLPPELQYRTAKNVESGARHIVPY